jgi:hypothetical protein
MEQKNVVSPSVVRRKSVEPLYRASLNQRMYLEDLRKKCGLSTKGIRNLSARAAHKEIKRLSGRILAGDIPKDTHTGVDDDNLG